MHQHFLTFSKVAVQISKDWCHWKAYMLQKLSKMYRLLWHMSHMVLLLFMTSLFVFYRWICQWSLSRVWWPYWMWVWKSIFKVIAQMYEILYTFSIKLIWSSAHSKYTAKLLLQLPHSSFVVALQYLQNR